MNKLRYFFQFLLIVFLFLIFKFLGLKNASYIGGKLFQIFGPFFRSKKIIYSNIRRAFPNITEKEILNISKNMWNNYGRVFAEYMFIKKYRNEFFKFGIRLYGSEILKKIKHENRPVIFISGHFANFELMAMTLEKMGIKLSAIYRPLNNKFLNVIMEQIRKKYICKFQIKKGVSGLREIIKLNKKGFSTALMIDQRVSEGILSNFFNKKAHTTTIPAQLVKKYGYDVVPISIERFDHIKFNIRIHKPLKYSKNTTTEEITQNLNNFIEKMLIKNPNQWIWSHNRWK